MRNIFKIILPVTLLFFANLACSLPIGATPSPDELANQASTAVAATLTALAPEPHGDVTLEPTVTPSVTATSELVPTITPLPDEAALRLAFTDRNGNLWTWQEGATPDQIISSGDVDSLALSPEGDWIAFTRVTSDYLETSLWSIRFDGSDEHLLISAEDFMAMPLNPDINADWVVSRYPFWLTFVPGSSTMLAFTTVPQFEGPGFIDNKDLWLVDVESGMRNNLLTTGNGGHFYYSPDGSQIAIVTPSDISLVNADGSNRRSNVLSYDPVLTYSEHAFHAEPKWSPDGSYLRVAIPYSDSLGDPSMPAHLYQLPTDGSSATFLGNVNFAPITSGTYAPDLTQLAYVQQIGDPASNVYALMTANFDGSEPVEIVRTGLGFSGWSLNSNHIAYQTWAPSAIFIAQAGIAGSGNLVKADISQFRWISDERFIFLHMAALNWEFRLGAIGMPDTIIATLAEGDRYPNYQFAGNP